MVIGMETPKNSSALDKIKSMAFGSAKKVNAPKKSIKTDNTVHLMHQTNRLEKLKARAKKARKQANRSRAINAARRK